MNGRHVLAAAALAAVAVASCGGDSKPDSSPAGAECELPQLRISTSTDQPRYEAGEVVMVTSSVTNDSRQPCRYAGSTFEYTVERASGQGLAGGAVHGDSFGMVTFASGQTLTNTGQWDQQDCTAGPGRCGQAAPGQYAVKVKWTLGELAVEDIARFELVERGR